MQPFTGIKVLDLTHVLAGPFCAYQLGVLGAEVIKIEPPGKPDMVRGPERGQDMHMHFLAQNSNKRSMILNLKTDRGIAILKKLVSTSDVFVENYTAGALERLGVGYPDLLQVNKELIYCSITGFGQDGPKRGLPAYDQVIQAVSGLMSTTGTTDTAPLKVGAPVIDYGTGMMAAFAVASALYQRTKTGRGQRIDVAMVDSVFMLMSSLVTAYLNDGVVPLPLGNESPFGATSGSCYQARDGLLMVGAYTADQHRNFWLALGQHEEAAITGVLSVAQINTRRDHHVQLLRSIIPTKTTAEWIAILTAAHVPVARVLTLPEALAEAQVAYRGVLQTFPAIPGVGENIRLPVAAFSYDHGGPALRLQPPRYGEHTDEILGELGLTASEIASLRADGVI